MNQAAKPAYRLQLTDTNLTIEHLGNQRRDKDLVRAYGRFEITAGEFSVYSELQMTAGHRRIRQTAGPGVEAGTDGEAVAEKGSGRARPGSRGSISVPTQADGGHHRPTRVTAVGSNSRRLRRVAYCRRAPGVAYESVALPLSYPGFSSSYLTT